MPSTTAFPSGTDGWAAHWTGGLILPLALALSWSAWQRGSGTWRLGLVGSKQTVFKRGSIEAPDDRVHLFRIGCVDEGESLGFLCLGITNDLHVVEDEVFCV